MKERGYSSADEVDSWPAIALRRRRGLFGWGGASPPAEASLLAGVPLAMVLGAVVVHDLRPLTLVVVLAGFVFASQRRDASRWAWAAAIPLSLGLAWGLLSAPAAPPLAAACGSLISPPALWRLAEALLVVGAALALARSLGGSPGLAFRWPKRWVVGSSAVIGLALVPVGLVGGQVLADPFFGPVRLQLGVIGAMAPALVFAFSNATLEEVAYRGALLGWSQPFLGASGALVFQAVLFGLAHMGPDFIGSPLPVVLAMVGGGLIAGYSVRRFGSIVPAIVIHAAFDIPLYYSLACRVA